MAITTEFVGDLSAAQGSNAALKSRIYGSIGQLSHWLEDHDYRAYDTFDGLNARLLRPLTFNRSLLRIVLQQGVRRFPLNLRPLLGITPERSTKGIGFLARGFIRLYRSTGDVMWRGRAESMLQWLLENKSPGYSGACWGNHFDYQSRSVFVTKFCPSVVWTSLIGHAFLDAYDQFHDEKYLETAISACNHYLERATSVHIGKQMRCASTTSRLPHIGCTTPIRWARACWPAHRPTHRMRCGAKLPRKLCSTQRNISSQTPPGTTEKRRICAGSITFIQLTFWIATTRTESRQVMIGSIGR